jgi:DNA-binding CsgD family transcriptional regulator
MSYEHVPCGRRVGRLYGPQSVWTLGQALDVQEGFDLGAADPDRVTGLEPARFLPNDGETSAPDLAGPWFPGLVDPVKATGPRSFACHYCWRVRYTSLLDRHGWNDFVTHISGGLLYGREVPRPLEHAQPQRKRRYSKQKAPRATPGRDAVLELLRAGLDDREIAQRRGITRGSVRRHMRALCKMQGVQSRQELNDRLNAAADGLKPVCRIELGVCTSARQERLPHSACTAHGA